MTNQSSPKNEQTSSFLPFNIEPLYFLLVAFPMAGILWLMSVDDLWIFIASCVAIIPLAGLMGRASENLAETMGAGIGGLLNATLGNAAELIIALMLLFQANAHPAEPDRLKTLELVKASITGSIMGNVLLVLGLAILIGGLSRKKQTFNRTAAGMGATLLFLACAGLLMPTIYYYLLPHTPEQTQLINYLSEEIAIVLAAVYILSLFFSLKTHQHLFAGPEEEVPKSGNDHHPEWSRRTSLIVLVASTLGIILMSELLVHSVEHAAEALGMNHIFIGVVVVAVIGNAAEHSTAVLMAAKNKMDLAYNIAVGSSIQIALFVAPVLIFASWLMGMDPLLDLHFSPLEIVAIIITIITVAFVAQDGESHWMEGIMLLAVYLIIALAFYHWPVAATH